MLRIPNPGSDISSFITIYCELYESLHDRISFGLDDISQTLVRKNLATSSGYMGDEALQRSTRADRSRDPLYNQSKMYSELFRSLGWFHSVGSALQFNCTYLGAHVLEVRRNPEKFFNECILGIAYPNAVLNVTGSYITRPFATILRTLEAMDGLLSRDELIVGPLCLENDRNAALFDQMIARLQQCRRNGITELQAWISEVSDSRGITTVTMGNYTRFPLAVMKWSGWTYEQRRKDIYGRSIPFIVLSQDGKAALAQVESSIDIRASDLHQFDEDTKAAFARVGFFDLLERAGFDISPFHTTLESGRSIIRTNLSEYGNQPLLFSPFQELPPSLTNSVFPRQQSVSGQYIPVARPSLLTATSYSTDVSSTVTLIDGEVAQQNNLEPDIQKLLVPLLTSDLDVDSMVTAAFLSLSGMNKGLFYPLVAGLFRALEFDCQHSRGGVNYSRADAFIIHPTQSIPIEIKSPGEEEFISVKGVRQALENKVILLSRRAYPTQRSTTSLVVGYNLPNDRSEVMALIYDIRTAFNLNIGVIDLKSLLYLVISKIIHGSTLDFETLASLYGIINVYNASSKTE